MEDRHTYRQNERHFKKKEKTMAHNWQIPSTCCSQLLSKALPRSRFATCSSGCTHSTCLKKQVYLYNWSLIRVGGDHPENGIQVAVEGSTTIDLLDHGKFRTAPIESRIEKCKLRTVDGMNILLMGVIDEQCSYENGFPLQVIHLFLTGFPFNWNHVVNTCCGQPCLNVSVLPTSKEKESVWQEKEETQNSGYIEIHMKNMGTGKSNLLEAEEKVSEVEEKLSKVTSRESLIRGSKRGRHGSSKRLKCGNLSINSKPKVFTPFVGLLNNSNQIASVKREDTSPDQMHLCTEAYENFERDDRLTESDSKLLRRKSLNFSVSQEDKDSVKNKGNTVNYTVSRSMKETRESEKQIDSGSFLDEAKLTQFVCSVTKGSGGADQTNGCFASAEDSFNKRIDKNETEQSPLVILQLQQLENNCTSGGEQTQKIQIPVSEFPNIGCKTGKLIPLDTSVTKRSRMNKSSRASRGQSCGEITEEVVKKASDVEHEFHSEKIICTRRFGKKCKKYTLFPSDSELRAIPNETVSPGEDGKGQIEVDCLVDDADFEFICKKEDVLSASAENKPFPLPENHLTNDVNKCVKQVNKSGTKRKGRLEIRTSCTDQPPELLEAFVCYQTNVNDSVMLKCNDTNATCGTTPYQGAREIEHGVASENCTEIGDNHPEGNDDGEGSMQTPKIRIEINMQTQTKKRQLVNNIPPTPLHRVYTTPEEVSKEFGLKTSRSGEISENKPFSLPENHLNSNVTKCVKQANKLGTKRRGRSKTRTSCTDQPPEFSEAFLCHQTNVNDSVMLKGNDINATCDTTPYKRPSEIENGMASEICTEIGENCPEGNGNGEGSMQTPKTRIEINMPTQTKKRQLVNNIPPTPLRHVHTTPEEVSKEFGLKTSISGGISENKPFSLPKNHLNSNVTKCVEQVNKLGTKRRGRSKTRTSCTDQPPAFSEAFLCHQTNVNDSVMLKGNDINATCDTTPYKRPSEIEHGMSSEICTEIGENCPEGNGNGEGNMQTPKTRIEIDMQTQTKKRQLVNNITPTPLRRVHTTPEEVSKAFGLKTSRSGRLLVPPLAHWCNQTIAYDMDGGIIAILDASSQRDKQYGSSIFKPPEQKDALLIRKKLCNAVNETNLTLRSAKKACKD